MEKNSTNHGWHYDPRNETDLEKLTKRLENYCINGSPEDIHTYNILR